MLNRIFWQTLIGTIALVILVIILLPKPQKLPKPEKLLKPQKEVSDNGTVNNQYDLVIANGSVFIDGRFIDGVNIAIKDGLIVELADKLTEQAALTIDAKDKVVMPSLVDAHTHSFGSALQQAINFGVSSHFDMFSPTTTLNDNKVNRSDLDYMDTDLFSAGMLATVAGGHGTQFGVNVETLAQPDQAKDWVAKRQAEGSDYIKLVYMPSVTHINSLDLATSKAIINAAHDQGLLAVAHIFNQSDAVDMVAAGIDGLVHQFADSAVSQEFLSRAQESNVFVIPTLAVIASISNRKLGATLAEMPLVAPYLSASAKAQLKAGFSTTDIHGFDLDVALSNTRLMHEAGITILAGSDAANPGTSWGVSLHQELNYLMQAGLGPEQALRSASELPFKVFGIKGQGKIEQTYRANLLILNKPLGVSEKGVSANSSLDIHTIIKNGKIVKRKRQEKSEETTNKPLLTPVLSNFEYGLQGPNVLTWQATDDSIMNGGSQAEIDNSSAALNVAAKVKAGFPYPWAGASIMSSSPIDLSQYAEIEFEISGTAGDYRVMLFDENRLSTPPVQTVKVTAATNSIRLKLVDFQNAQLDRVVGFTWVAGPKIGEYKFTLDDVKVR